MEAQAQDGTSKNLLCWPPLISGGLKKAFLGLAAARCWVLADQDCSAKQPVGSLLFPYQSRRSAPMLGP